MRTAPNRTVASSPGPDHPNQTSDWRATVNGTRIEKPYPMDSKAVARFSAKVQHSNNGCWEWTSWRNRNGYGAFFYGKQVSAHRTSYQHYVGQIPKGFDIDHLCHNRACVNPSHLEAITHHENLLRSRNTMPGRNSRKTHCTSGHLLRDYEAGKLRNCLQCKGSKEDCAICGKQLASTSIRRHLLAKHGEAK